MLVYINLESFSKEKVIAAEENFVSVDRVLTVLHKAGISDGGGFES